MSDTIAVFKNKKTKKYKIVQIVVGSTYDKSMLFQTLRKTYPETDYIFMDYDEIDNIIDLVQLKDGWALVEDC